MGALGADEKLVFRYLPSEMEAYPTKRCALQVVSSESLLLKARPAQLYNKYIVKEVPIRSNDAIMLSGYVA
jgi:hypothetical protein